MGKLILNYDEYKAIIKIAKNTLDKKDSRDITREIKFEVKDGKLKTTVCTGFIGAILTLQLEVEQSDDFSFAVYARDIDFAGKFERIEFEVDSIKVDINVIGKDQSISTTIENHEYNLNLESLIHERNDNYAIQVNASLLKKICENAIITGNNLIKIDLPVKDGKVNKVKDINVYNDKVNQIILPVRWGE